MCNSAQLKQYALLMRLDKPIGIFLLLWPTLWALWLASAGKPNLIIAIIFILGVIVMRSAGCVINDFADRKFDPYVDRTQSRPMATGKVTTKEALVLFACLLFVAFLLIVMLNQLTISLAIVGAILAILYPFLKRYTHLPQLGLGLAFAWGVPMAFAALTDTVPAQAWIVFFAAAWWPIIYDTIYAMADREDDIKIGVKSTAILFNQYDRLIIGMMQLFFVLILLWMGYAFRLAWPFYLSLIGVVLLFLYQQKLIKHREPQACIQAFLNNHWVGMIIFAGIVLSYEL